MLLRSNRDSHDEDSVVPAQDDLLVDIEPSTSVQTQTINIDPPAKR